MKRLTYTLQCLLPALVLVAAGGAQATSPPLPTPDELVEFYEVMDGDNWTRNDGWLDEDVHHCQWFGVSCDGAGVIDTLFLPSNNLAGDLNDTDLLRLFERLYLSNNRIRGTLSSIPSHTEVLDLAHNQMDGDLPGVSGEEGQDLFKLDLANNAFSGEVPESWEALELSELNLSNNKLTGTTEGAFRAMETDGPGSIFLADNQFAGELSPSLADRDLFINLCWNDFEINDPTLAEWVAENHAGGPDFDTATCTNRERLAIDPGLSGSWFNPERDGEGLSLMLLDNGAPLVYWFTHISKGRQMWLFKVGETDDPTLFFPRWLQTEGRFGEGFGDAEIPLGAKGTLRLDHIQDDVLHGQYLVNYINKELEQEGEPGFPTIVPMPHRFLWDHVRLSQLAGTTCDTQRENQWISGAWYDPERNGEGFMVEVLEDGRGVVYWFTYTPDGEEQAWMMGVGDFDGTTLHIDNLVQPRDTAEGMPFDASGIEKMDWGTLTMEFDDDQSGHVSFDSDFEDFGSGEFSLQRLARPKLAECGGGQ